MDINLIMEDEELRELVNTSEKWQRLLDSLPLGEDLCSSRCKIRDKIEDHVFDSKLEVMDRLETLIEDN